MSALKIKIKFHSYSPETSEIDSCYRIQEILERQNIHADLETCASLWKEYSDNNAAGWLFLPEDDYELESILKSTIRYLI